MIHPGDIIDGRYRLEEQISQGGVGTIWRATQEPPVGGGRGRVVALKLLRPEMSRLPHLRRRFAREARAASRLSHPNIAAVYDFGVDETSRMFIAMELIEGDPVTRCIETGLSVLNVLLLADLLLAGLAHAHARGVIHRDLKPSNVLLAGSSLPEKMGNPKVVDFGIAKVSFENTSERETGHGEVVGTPRYMSPEQAAGEANLGPQTDIYNVGLILYELITSEPPFGEQKGLAVMSQHVHDPIPAMIPRAGLSVPSELRNLVMRALSKRPRDRWATAAEFRRDLAPLIEQARQNPDAERVPTQKIRITDEQTLRTARSTLQETSGISDRATTVVDRPSHAVAEPALADSAVDVQPDVMKQVRGEVMDAAMGPAFQRVPFVGRIAERERLWEIAEEVSQTGRGRNVLVHGEAGVGKTRLSMWLKEQCEEHGVLRAHIGAFSRGASGGLRGLHEVLESIFGTRRLSRDEVEERVGWHLERWGQPEHDDLGPIVEFLRPHGRAAGDSWSGSLSTSALFAVVARVLELASLHRPRLVILDDVHWAGGELAEFLDYLSVEMRHRTVPLLVLSTVRTEDLAERPRLAAQLNALSRYVGESVERINLERLDRDVSYRLVEAIFPCDERLTEIVYERSAGNPLHLMLLLRYLREEGLLESDGGVWRAKNLAQVGAAMPPSLADLFHVRVQQVEDRLGTGGELTAFLVRAAVIGPRFSYAVLARLAELEGDGRRLADFDVHFDRLLAEGLINEVEGRGEDWYQFSHALLRDYFLRENLGPALYKKLHRLAAEAMVDALGRRLDQFALEIAAHWRAGERTEEALHWYRRGAKALRASSMYRQAAAAYAVCVELMDARLGVSGSGDGELPEHDDTDRFDEAGVVLSEYLDTLVRLGELLEGFGEFDRAEATFRRVVRMVAGQQEGLSEEVLRALGHSWMGMGHIAWQRGDFEAAEWAFEKVRELVGGHSSLQSVDEDAARGLSRVFWHRGEYARAEKLARAALESAMARKDLAAEASSLWLLGEIDRMQGEGESSRVHYQASLELYRQADDPTGVARNLLSMAQLARHHKAFGDAETLYQRALSRYETLGDRRGAGQCHNGLGDIARFEERYEDARENYARALDIYEAIGAEYDKAVVYTNLGLTAIALADYEAADEYLSAAGSMVTGDEYPYLLAGVEFNLALVKSLRGDMAQSEQILGDVLELAERFPIPDPDYAQPLERLGRLRAAAGDTREAVELWKKAAEIYRELELGEDLKRVQGYIAGEKG